MGICTSILNVHNDRKYPKIYIVSKHVGDTLSCLKHWLTDARHAKICPIDIM